LQDAKDVAAATPNLEDVKAIRKPADRPEGQSGKSLVSGPEPEVPILGGQQSLDARGVKSRPVALIAAAFSSS
jgi:hypothetical protein